ncbi:DUF502 domain-containing protein [Geoalkalibacter halelectricus]|uniref:DUF502 domain-containing protein n=1 Tax=Geoalkalibacter halelectricus TaxID=2847045 RepID=UPI003D1F1D97
MTSMKTANNDNGAAQPPKGHWGRRIGHHLKTKIAAGLLVVIPAGVTIFILRFLFNLADGVLAPYIRKTAVFIFGEGGRYIPGLGMIAGILVIYVSGLIASNVFGKRLIHTWDRILSRIPLVKSIYSSSKQLISVFSTSGRDSFRRAVYVEFPKEGSFSIAFVTNSVPTPSGKNYYTVFIPTSPNPTSGYVLILEESKVYPTEFSVEEAMKIIMSGGIVVPEDFLAQKLQ